MYNVKLRNIITRIYLRHVADEKVFRERLYADKQIFEAPNKESSKTLERIIQESLIKTKFRQGIIRMTSPIYVILFARSLRTIGHKVMIKNEKILKRCNIIILADFLLRSLHAARMQRNYPLFFKYDKTKFPFPLKD